MQGKLAVAAAFHPQFGDDPQSGGAQHLVFLVGQGDGRGYDDGVAGVDAHRVQVFHGADGDHVVLGVPDHLKLDFLPAGNAFFHQNLGNGGEAQAVAGDVHELFLVLGDAAAGAA